MASDSKSVDDGSHIWHKWSCGASSSFASKMELAWACNKLTTSLHVHICVHNSNLQYWHWGYRVVNKALLLPPKVSDEQMQHSHQIARQQLYLL